MKMVLICPGERAAVAALMEGGPLALLPVLGKTVLEHWLEHAARQGIKQVSLSASDRAEQVCKLAGDGSRWGLRAGVRTEARELDVAEARHKYRMEKSPEGPGLAGEVILMDHLPQMPGQGLFESYAGYFWVLQRLLAKQLFPNLIGLRELKPGVWVGRRSRLASDAQLRAPCWVGENVWVDSGAIVGPGAIVEHCCYIGSGAEVVASLVAPETFVGESTDVKQSLAWGSTLINWRTNSCLKVPDAWLLCGLRERHVFFKEVTWPSQVASWLVLGLSLPMGAAALLKTKLEEVPALRRLGIRD